MVFAENVKHWLSAWKRLHHPAGDLLPRLNVWFAITVAAMLLNPYGLLSYDIFIEFFRDNALAGRVGEFLPPRWETNAPFWVFLGVTGITVAASRKHWALTHLAVLLPFTALSVRYERATAIFALVATPVLAALLPRLLLRRLAADPNIYPRLMHEIGTYLAYRRAPRVSFLFAELLAQAGNLLPAEERAQLVKRALRFNLEDGNLQPFVAPRVMPLPAQ